MSPTDRFVITSFVECFWGGRNTFGKVLFGIFWIAFPFVLLAILGANTLEWIQRITSKEKK